MQRPVKGGLMGLKVGRGPRPHGGDLCGCQLSSSSISILNFNFQYPLLYETDLPQYGTYFYSQGSQASAIYHHD